jgi:hypothetical protein
MFAKETPDIYSHITLCIMELKIDMAQMPAVIPKEVDICHGHNARVNSRICRKLITLLVALYTKQLSETAHSLQLTGGYAATLLPFR